MQRLTYIDSIKGLGIVLVILYHCQYVPFDSMLIRGIYALCVPVFFMVNGYLMLTKEHSLHALLRKNLKLLLVLFVWAMISTALNMWKDGMWSDGTIFEGMKAWLYHSFLIPQPHWAHLWFLRTLFFLNLFNPILYYFIHYKPRGVYYLLILLGVCTIRIFDTVVAKFENPLMGGMWYAVLYYVLGYALLDGHLRTDKLETKWLWVIIVALIVGQYIYNRLLTVGPWTSFNARFVRINDIVWDGYNAPLVVLLTCAVCLAFQRIPWRSKGILQSIGVYSLAIYVMQTPVQRLYEMFLPLNEWSARAHVCGLILPVLTLVTCYIIARLLNTNKYTAYLVKI